MTSTPTYNLTIAKKTDPWTCRRIFSIEGLEMSCNRNLLKEIPDLK